MAHEVFFKNGIWSCATSHSRKMLYAIKFEFFLNCCVGFSFWYKEDLDNFFRYK